MVEENPDFVRLFESAPSNYLVLDRSLHIVAVNEAYLAASMRQRETLVGLHLFEAFPDNPDDPSADGVRNLRASLERVLATGKPDVMAVQKYDIARPASQGGGFDVRYWSPRNVPVLERGAVTWLIHCVEDVTEYVRLRQSAEAHATETGRMEAEILRSSRELQQANDRLRETEARLTHLNLDLEARVADEMRERARAEERFRQAQKMEAVGQLAGGIAHDFNNLLTIMLSCAALLGEEPLTDSARSDLNDIEQAAKRAATLTRQLLAFSRRQVLNPVLLNLDEVVSSSEPMLRRLIGEQVEMVSSCASPLSMARVDRALVEQVLMNLVVNARDAMPEGGTLRVETKDAVLSAEPEGATLGAAPGPYVMLAVTDTGTGMSRETREQIFLPFFTTKGVGKGTGLGLSMVHGVVKQSQGELVVKSELGRGTRFEVYLPVATGEVTSQLTPHPSTAVGKLSGHEVILLVEDEAHVREVAQRVLERAGYTVLTAGRPSEAVALCRSRRERIDLLLTDVVMPEMDGPTLVDVVLRERPELQVLYMSGYTGRANVRSLDRALLLPKPFTPPELLSRVREALDQPQPIAQVG